MRSSPLAKRPRRWALVLATVALTKADAAFGNSRWGPAVPRVFPPKPERRSCSSLNLVLESRTLPLSHSRFKTRSFRSAAYYPDTWFPQHKGRRWREKVLKRPFMSRCCANGGNIPVSVAMTSISGSAPVPFWPRWISRTATLRHAWRTVTGVSNSLCKKPE